MGNLLALEPGVSVRLSDIDPRYRAGMSREKVESRLAETGPALTKLTDTLFAAGSHALLVILQGRDTAGKDGLIRRLLTLINAQSCQVAPFKVPTADEVAHDFLWRVHARVPGRGGIALFNRSHYEDVLVVRVHNIVAPAVWRARYEHINQFERLLTDSGVIVAKFMLHISKDEQRERLIEREQDPSKAWKLNVGDWQERDLWASYEDAYEDALQKCGTPHAPWHVVPADHKWYRDLVVVERLIEILRPFENGWLDHLSEIAKTQRKALDEFRAKQTHDS